MRLVLGLVACAACTSSPGDPDGTLGVLGGGDPGTRVRTAASGRLTAKTASVEIPTTQGGELLVVGVTYANLAVPAVTVQTDAGDPLMIQLVHADGCLSTTSLHVVGDASAGARSVEVTLSSVMPFDVFVLEIADVTSKFPADAATASEDSMPSATAPAVDAMLGDVVVSGVATCGPVAGIEATSPFTSFDDTMFGDIAYYVPGDPGSYGADWIYSGGAFEAFTVAFR